MVRSGEFESPWTDWKSVIITRLDQERVDLPSQDFH